MRTSGDGGVHGQSSAYGADGMRSREEGALQGPGSWDGASTASQVHSDARTGMTQERGHAEPCGRAEGWVQYAPSVAAVVGLHYTF